MKLNSLESLRPRHQAPAAGGLPEDVRLPRSHGHAELHQGLCQRHSLLQELKQSFSPFYIIIYYIILYITVI